MNYAETIDYLYSKLPMFTRIGVAAIKKDLDNTIAFCEALDNPHHKFKSIHIAGTNGKGSTSHMLAAILQKAGYKTGLYTSPHLKDFRERIRINGKMVSKSAVTKFVKSQTGLINKIEPSFFEVTVAMAFDYFAKEKVDIAIIEVGLGGRLDSTNIINPLLSVITNISLDHTNILGDNLPAIAFEKAGIIKTHTPVVISEFQPEIETVFKQKANQENAPLYYANELSAKNSRLINGRLNFDLFKNDQIILPNLQLDLTGKYQLKNVLGVIQSISLIREKGFEINDEAIDAGLKAVKKTTGLQGRWQTLSKNPLVICDTGHNKSGIAEVIENINSIKFEKLHLVIGMVKDKDISAVLAQLPSNAIYYFCQPNLERALPAQELASQAAEFNLVGQYFSTVKDAFENAKQIASVKDLIFVGGSTFVVAEVL